MKIEQKRNEPKEKRIEERAVVSHCPYLPEELLHESFRPARVQSPGLGGVTDVSRVQQQGQRFGLVDSVGRKEHDDTNTVFLSMS
jgi:hypothetical protein